MKKTIELQNTALREYVLGRGFAYPLREDPRSGDVLPAEGEANVRGCVELIMDSGEAEWPMQEYLGHRAAALLFADKRSVEDVLPLEMQDALSIEQRIRNVSVSTESVGARAVRLKVSWRYKSSNTPDSTTVERARD